VAAVVAADTVAHRSAAADLKGSSVVGLEERRVVARKLYKLLDFD